MVGRHHPSSPEITAWKGKHIERSRAGGAAASGRNAALPYCFAIFRCRMFTGCYHQRAYFIWHLKSFWSDMWRVTAAKVLCWQYHTRPNPAVYPILFSLGNSFCSKMSIIFPSRITAIIFQTIKCSPYVINTTVNLLTLCLLSDYVMTKTYRTVVYVYRSALFWVITQRVGQPVPKRR